MSFSDAYGADYDTVTTGGGGGWAPGDPWPGSEGGALRDEWSGYVRVYLQAQIAAGTAFVMGDDRADRLDAGNVLSEAGTVRSLPSTLWVDLSCDVTDLDISLGGSTGQGILTKAEAGTLTATLWDPAGRYDPTNPDTPYALGHHTRLTPGAAVRCWAEVIHDPTAGSPDVWVLPLFWGTADRWAHTWTQEPGDRYATLVASDPTKTWTRFNQPELPVAVGAGDDPLARLNRLKTVYGWGGNISQWGTATVTLAASTLAQAGWELATRAAADELGIVYFQPQGPDSIFDQGAMILLAREVFTSTPTPALEIGCGPGQHDIATQVIPASFDDQLKNSVYAARSGGTQQHVASASSVAKYWEQSLNRTDLGLQNDTQVGAWAAAIVALYAYPQTAIDHMTLRPDLDPEPWVTWRWVLGSGLITNRYRIVWDQGGYTVDTLVRVAGWTQKITPDKWEVEWRTVSAVASTAAYTFTMGPDTQDQLDAGYVLT